MPQQSSARAKSLVCLVFSPRFIEHCVYLGQADYGGNAALHAEQIFKHAFEIELTGKTAIVNQC
jgi:hypothetical protein